MFTTDAELDFHNYNTLQPFDIEKILNEFLEDSQIFGYKNVLVITGKGKVVRPIVKKLLGNNKFVESFRIAGYFNGQDGAFEVLLS